MFILRDRVLKAMEKYEEREDDVIYAHMLDSPVWKILVEKKVITKEMIIGEILHQGVGNMLDPVESVCREVRISPRVVDKLDRRIRERFIKQDYDGYYVKICGTADAFYNGYPVELKTTRSGRKFHAPKKEWIRRTKVYAWLYKKERGYLIVLNVISGDEANYEVTPFTDNEMRDIVERWLEGSYPTNTLPVMVKSLDNSKTLI